MFLTASFLQVFILQSDSTNCCTFFTCNLSFKAEVPTVGLAGQRLFEHFIDHFKGLPLTAQQPSHWLCGAVSQDYSLQRGSELTPTGFNPGQVCAERRCRTSAELGFFMFIYWLLSACFSKLFTLPVHYGEYLSPYSAHLWTVTIHNPHCHYHSSRFNISVFDLTQRFIFNSAAQQSLSSSLSGSGTQIKWCVIITHDAKVELGIFSE